MSVNSQSSHPFHKGEELISNTFFNSCFHPNEFGIGSYRITSLINMSEEGKKNSIPTSNFVIPYLDTLSGGKLKGFPNIQMRNKQPLVNNIVNTLNQDVSLKQKVILLNSIYSDFLDLLCLDHKIPHPEVLHFINTLLLETGVFSEINIFIKTDKGGNEKKLNEFLHFLFKEKIKNFLKTSYQLIKQSLQENPSSHFTHNEVLGVIQNVIISEVIQKGFTQDQKEDMKNIGVLKETRVYIPFLQYHEKNGSFIQAVTSILENTELGENFLETFFKKLLENKTQGVQIADFGDTFLSHQLFVGKDSDSNLVFFTKDKNKKITEIERDVFYSILTPEDSTKIAYCGNILMFIKSIFGSKHIGSERNFRFLCEQTLQDFFGHNKYSDKIFSGQLYDTFDEKSDNIGKKLAGSIGTIPSDMTKMIFLPMNHIRNQIQKAIGNNLEIPECDVLELLKGFAEEQCAEKKHSFDFSYENHTIKSYLEFLFLCFNSNK